MDELESNSVLWILGCDGLRADNPTDAAEMTVEVAMLTA